MPKILIDLERSILNGITTYWKGNRHGYTNRIDEAGIFSDQEADKEVSSDFDKRTVAVDQKVVDRLLNK
ncbi:hypothetical protein [Fictibacillus sp. NRS-1165]|uniref:hypothetical protein n=1 Tax=Fictibacillus sp. NRS-1165 TaxID=3144463 RepID=UPI003D1EF9D2